MPTELPTERAIRAPGSMELDPLGEGISTDETRRLIASNKVEGTAVFDRADAQIGTIYNFMVDKVSGQVAYVVMSFGGFLGMGGEEHTIPSGSLHYDTSLGGYRTNITEEQLRGAPAYSRDRDTDWSDRQREQDLHDHYRAPYYWGGI